MACCRRLACWRAGFDPDAPLPSDVTWADLRQAFWAVRQTNIYATDLRNEAAEFDVACAYLSSSCYHRANNLKDAEGQNAKFVPLGLVCRWCWRTEANWRSIRSPYGACDLHFVPTAESARVDPDPGPRSAPDYVNAARRREEIFRDTSGGSTGGNDQSALVTR